ncbi:(2Fe-2S)-binding protein [Arhodomonas sp. AD133]|uniref:(2Fe-2S)-binding protein n=1 Tax=Arhodomonas sp. AD133 TaxID=3415009 RepID=UPI003EB97777
MFKRLPDDGRSPVAFEFEGGTIAAREGDTVAAALLANDVLACRATPVSAAPRAPYCMMGVCYECLVEIDGEPNRQACQEPVRPGMRVARQQGAREVDA